MMDILWEAANYYNKNLEGRKFRVKAGKRKKLLELDIYFRAENFFHLIGLHKLVDIPIMNTDTNAKKIYRQILDGKITYDDIKNSNFFNQMEDRLDSFHQLKELLFSKDLMFQSSHGYFRSIQADYLLLRRNKESNVCFFCKDNKKGLVVPVTFFERVDNEYVSNNPIKWTVLSVEEVYKGENL